MTVNMIMLKRLIGYFGNKTWVLSISMALTIAASATEASLLAQIQPLIDTVFSNKQPSYIWLIPAILVAAFIVRGVLTFCSNYLNQWLMQNALAALRRAMFNKLLHLPDATFKQERSASILAKFTTDANNALSSLTEMIMVTIRESALVLFIMGYLLWLNWQLTLIVLLTLPLSSWVARQFSHRLTHIARMTQDSNALMIGAVKEAVAAQRMVKIYDAYTHESDRFSHLVQKLRRLGMRSTVATAATGPVTQTIAALGFAVVIALAIYQNQNASTTAVVTAGVFTGLITNMVGLFQPLKNLANISGAYARTVAAADSVFEFLDQSDERHMEHAAAATTTTTTTTGPSAALQAMPQGALTIAVEGVTMLYADNDVPALDAVSFTLEAGKTTTLLGRSGSGKSTFAALLPRLIEPTHGSIRINGVRLQDIRLSALRDAIAMVTQEALLVDDTVAANVAYGDAAADEARVWAALEAASMADTVRDLPLGLHTLVGEGGSRFSGGQRQRLTIARAFYKNAPILILDEATSALDVDSEAHIQTALKALMQGRTCLVITHRLATIAQGSHIVLLEAGRVVTQGSHAALLAAGGAYAKLVQS
jgi:ATP-binding cassette, subfamily B, bacterial MsbA